MMPNSWKDIKDYAALLSKQEQLMANFFEQSVQKHPSCNQALASLLAKKLSNQQLPATLIYEIALEALSPTTISESVEHDLQANFKRDSACTHPAIAFLFNKGFHALQGYRVAHHLWHDNQAALALLFQSRISSVFDVDIHPAAVLGHGIMLDHATGIVIGETARVGDDVSIMQGVTLGGTCKEQDDRHPKIANGVLISCGAKILGNIHIGENSKIAAGSVVLKTVKPNTTVAGVPAQAVGQVPDQEPALNMNHQIDCDSVNIALHLQSANKH